MGDREKIVEDTFKEFDGDILITDPCYRRVCDLTIAVLKDLRLS